MPLHYSTRRIGRSSIGPQHYLPIQHQHHLHEPPKKQANPALINYFVVNIEFETRLEPLEIVIESTVGEIHRFHIQQCFIARYLCSDSLLPDMGCVVS